MTFKEILEKAKKFDIPVWKLLVVSEVTCQFEDLSDEDVEKICEFIYEWVMHTEMPADELCSLIKTCLEENLFTLKDFDSNWDKITDILNDRI